MKGPGTPQVDLGIWGKLTRFILVLLVLAGILGIAIWYLPLIQQNQRMRQEILNLKLEIQKEEAQSRWLKAQISALQKDPKTVERLAREKLGFARPGETVIRFEAATTNPPSAFPGR